MELTKEYLRSVLDYDLITGIFVWKVRKDVPKSTNTRMAGKIAGTISKSNGYLVIRISGKLYLAHRLAFIYVLGYVPEFVDHKDRNRTNCAWINLRPSTRQQNNINVTPTSNTGELNIYWVENKGHFLVSIKRGDKIYQKTWTTLESAILDRDRYKQEILNEKSS